MNNVICDFLSAFAVGYLPGAVLGLIIFLVAKKSRPMPLFHADTISFAAPLIVWFIMDKAGWTLVESEHNDLCELVLLGWIWSFTFCCRFLIPCFTHRLRFRLAAIHVGSIGIIAAVLLALFYR